MKRDVETHIVLSILATTTILWFTAEKVQPSSSSSTFTAIDFSGFNGGSDVVGALVFLSAVEYLRCTEQRLRTCGND